MWEVSWTVKASKGCNLRCTYCYEWDELAHRERISPDQWERVFDAALRYHRLQQIRFDEPGLTNIVWHGGEPLLLASAYVESVLERQRRVLGAAPARGELCNRLQTNLFAVSDARLDLLAREHFHLGVSIDWAPGVRLDQLGRPTEPRVMRNLQRVLERRIPVTVATVLGSHTLAELPRIHDVCAELSVPLNLIPMFDAPQLASHPFLVPTDRAIVDALMRLYEHWIAAACPIPVEPLSTCLITVLQRGCGLGRPQLDRRTAGESFLTVNTNGDLYLPRERYGDGKALGNIFSQSIDGILASPACRASFDRDEELIQRHCRSCTHRGACDGHPVLARPHAWPAGPCPIVARVCDRIAESLAAEGFDARAIRAELPLNDIATARLAA